MQLVIIDNNYKYDYNFLNAVLNKMQIMGIASYNPDKVYNQELYINKIPKYRSIYKKHISTKEAVIAGMVNLMWSKNGNKIIFEIDYNQYLPQTPAKLNEICKMINYGTLSFQPYPIFSNLFNLVRKEFDNWYDIYKEGGIL